tara:strand:+ start:5474 stop:5683 length:210 start_codon:yes stop_codon:yes gene_type:complete
MKFLVHLVAERGKAKSVIVNAADIKDAEKVAEKEFPLFEVGRITSDSGSISYFEGMKEIKKIGQIRKGL